MRKYLIILFLLLVAGTAQAQYSAVRINALGIATGTIHVGADVAVSQRWSVDVSGYWNPIATDALQAKVLAGTLGVRRWHFEPHVGLFWGVHTTVAKYRVGNRNTRYDGWTVGVGASVGHSWMLATRWNLTLEGGVGIYYMKDVEYTPHGLPTEDIVLKKYKRFVLAPAKLEVAISYLF